MIAADFRNARDVMRLGTAQPLLAALKTAKSLGARITARMGRVRRALRARRPMSRPRNLIHDTAYRRARAAAVRVVHGADDLVAELRGGRRRVLFEAASPVSFAVFRPVLALLQGDPRIEFWFTTSDGAWAPEAVFGPVGITERVIGAADAKWMKFDAYINTDFWNMTWLPRRSRRVHLFHGVAGKYGLDAPTHIAPVVATFDRLLFANRDRLRRYADAGLIDPDGEAAALVGYPKVDCLVDGSLDRSGVLRRIGLDPAAPTVLYAPTWSPYSSLSQAGASIITSLARRGGNVIVKLHDRSYDTSDRASGGVDWRLRLERVCREYDVHLADGFDTSPYLVAADVLVTDHSSVGFEYMLLDRPIVVIDCPQLLVHARVSQEKAALLRGAAEVVDAADVAAGVGRALADPWRQASRRRAIADAFFYDPGRASARAADCIYDVLALSHSHNAPSHAVAARPGLSSFETRTI